MDDTVDIFWTNLLVACALGTIIWLGVAVMLGWIGEDDND